MMKLTRRQFLAGAAASGLVALPGLYGYHLFRRVQGESPPLVSPYVTLPITATPQNGVPILLLVDEKAVNPFGLYLAEILWAEGINSFQIAPLSILEQPDWDQFDLILLPETWLSTAQVERLERFVRGGGGLVALRPPTSLAPLLGLQPFSGTAEGGYWHVAAEHSLSQGARPEALQFHGPADHYHLAGAEVVAWITDAEAYTTSLPAVTLHQVGEGFAAAWSFDPVRSVIYTRQGNPIWGEQPPSPETHFRPPDMFADWLDMARIAIPQADELQRLLVNLLMTMNQTKRPLPRLWYLPGMAQTILVATCDAHQDPMTSIEAVLTRVEAVGGQASVYYLPPLYAESRRLSQLARWQMAALNLMESAYLPSPEQVAVWRGRGHEFTLHPQVDTGLEAGWAQYWESFTGLDYGPLSPTTRTHGVRWQPWVETARHQASCGLRLNLDFYHYGYTLRHENGEWGYGYFTGSGRPMRFVDEQGRLFTLYQQLTHLADDHLLKMVWGDVVGLPAEEAVWVAQTLMRQSLEGTHSAITAIFHADMFREGGTWARDEAIWLEGTLEYAAAHHIPIWSAEKWLRFTEQRNHTQLVSVVWDPATRWLRFHLTVPPIAEESLTVLVPATHGESHLAEVWVDEQVIRVESQIVGGRAYGAVVVGAGSYRIEARYG
ncbi:MAG: twin-arginine translocation signal domain-containing protein [Chloroflexi bacterium]|nr:twin-arginine translocation signal domain-containing protein [Chloroflexota bacterium]MBP8056810.1 twin-arginine translocation signal domain-containing protein [Chloroflexota bacterium]